MLAGKGHQREIRSNKEILFMLANLHMKRGRDTIKLIKGAPVMIQVKGLIVGLCEKESLAQSH